MTKVKNPVYSLGAKGSLGDAISFRKSRSVSIAEKKPKLPYFLTLPVQYQRWLYEDYAYLWTQQSQAIKDFYRASGGRHHLTAFQYWMKYQLTNLPDIAGWWKLDEKTGAIAYDSSRNSNHGAIIGAGPAIGVIDGGYFFDGVNDRITVPHSESLSISGYHLSMEMGLSPRTLVPAPLTRIITSKLPWGPGFRINTDLTGLGFTVHTTNGALTVTWPAPLVAYKEYHVTGTYDGVQILLYLDAVPTVPLAENGALVINALPFYIGTNSALNRYSSGVFDNIILRDRTLDQTEITRHSARRWPH